MTVVFDIRTEEGLRGAIKNAFKRNRNIDGDVKRFEFLYGELDMFVGDSLTRPRLVKAIWEFLNSEDI